MGVPNWTGPWSISTTYNQYDLASYLGSSWISSIGLNTGHAPGSDESWALFASAGQNTPFSQWRGDWGSTINYAAYDSVYYGGASYASLIGPNTGNTPSPTSSQWALIAGQGGSGAVGTFTFLGVWSVLTQYANNNIVSYLGSSYIATNTPPVSTLPTNTTYWTLMSSVGAQGPTGVAGVAGATGLGLTWRGAWSISAAYHVNDVVGLIGNSYIAVSANTGVNPSTDGGANWQLAAQGSSPIGIPLGANLFLTSYTQATGVFTAAQPTFSNLAGLYTPASYTVSNLPAGTEGQFAYATNGRKVSELPGSPPAPVGTGVPVYFSHGQWRVFSTDAQVQS
jgi:hypothetical protein